MDDQAPSFFRIAIRGPLQILLQAIMRKTMFAHVSITFALTFGMTVGSPGGAWAQEAQVRQAQAPDRNGNVVIMRSTDMVLTEADYDLLLLSTGKIVNPQFAPRNPDYVRQIAEMHSLAVAARARKLDVDPATRLAVDVAIDKVLAEALERNLVASATPSESEVKAYYGTHGHEYDGYSLSHILVRFERDPSGQPEAEAKAIGQKALDRARALKRKVDKGAEFHDLAAEVSDDADTRMDGGRVSPMLSRFIDDSFVEPVMKLKVGEVSEPVRSRYGYHLIRLDEKDVSTYSRDRFRVTYALKEEMAKQQIDAIKHAAAIELNPAFFAGSEPSLPASH